MGNPTDETYVPLSRGIEEHLPKMVGGCRAALWLLLLVRAQHSGPNRGKVNASFRELADALGVSYPTAYRAAQDLKKVGLIAYEPAPNQHRPTAFRVSKYKGVGDFHPTAALIKSDESSKVALINNETAVKQQRNSRFDKANNISELQDPNNDKNVKKIYTVEIEEVFDAYKVIMDVRSYSESRKSKIRARLGEYGKNEVLKAIENYRLALDDPNNHWTHRFPVEDFMTPKNIDRFLAMEPPAEEEWREMPDAHQ